MEAVRACEFSIISLIVNITVLIFFFFYFSLQKPTTTCHFYNRSTSVMYWEFLPSKEMRNSNAY
jgi:hypothetical protein